MTEDRPKIPEPIKREVRQRCGFGCVICGLPIYEYEHMIDWATTKHHVAAEITLLCSRHHSEKTRGFLPIAQLQSANENPLNLQSETSHPYPLHFSGQNCLIDLGSNQALHSFDNQSSVDVLVINGATVIKFEKEGDHLLLSLTICNAQGKEILKIERNELIYSTEPWDIELIGTVLTIRAGLGKILARLQFDPPRGVRITRGIFCHEGRIIRVDENYLLDEQFGFRMSNSRSENNSGAAFRFD